MEVVYELDYRVLMQAAPIRRVL